MHIERNGPEWFLGLSDLEDLARHAFLLRPGMTFCALAPGAAEPLQSALKYFREDFERAVAG